MNVLIASQLLLALSSALDETPRAAQLTDPPAVRESGIDFLGLLRERRELLQQRPTLDLPVMLFAFSAIAGAGAVTMGYLVANPSYLDVLSLVAVTIVLAVTHVALGVLGSWLLSTQILARAQIDRRLAPLDARLEAFP